MLKVLGIPASNSDNSINAMLVHYALDLMKTRLRIEAEYSVLDLNDLEMPIYKAERETAHGIPGGARDFVRAIGFADALVMSFAEHNGNYTAAFKNVLDWASRIERNVYHNRPILMMATSPGARGGAGVLGIASESAAHFSGNVFGTFSLPRFHEAFDQESNILLDAAKSAELATLLEGFANRLTAAKP
ncbi:MAG: NADPH-dependent FMN reductase [Candidatus Phaeomarinobacter sp.]